jgi:cholesterol transport system auxiliary component
MKERSMTVILNRKFWLRTGLGLTAAMSLSACITLLPEEKPAQLYRFSYNAEAVAPDPVGKSSKTKAIEAPAEVVPEIADPDRLQLYMAGIEFPKQASSDRIMTTEGSEVSFIAHARWASSASDLFQEALSEGFDRAATQVHLSSQIKGASKYRLELKVRRFEVSYVKKRPTVTVGLDANIVRISDRKLVAARYITSDVGVAKSDVSLIVDGFEKATSRVVYGVVKFTEEAAPTPDAVKPKS